MPHLVSKAYNISKKAADRNFLLIFLSYESKLLLWLYIEWVITCLETKLRQTDDLIPVR